MANWFVGIKKNGLRELNKCINNKKIKSKTIDKTIDNIENKNGNIVIIQFDDSNNVYIGRFLYADDGIKVTKLKSTAKYKKLINEIKKDLDSVGIDENKFITEKSEKMK